MIPELPHLPELPKLPVLTTLESFNEPMQKFGNVWLRTSEIVAVIDRQDTRIEVYFHSLTQPFILTGPAANEYLEWLQGQQDE